MKCKKWQSTKCRPVWQQKRSTCKELTVCELRIPFYLIELWLICFFYHFYPKNYFVLIFYRSIRCIDQFLFKPPFQPNTFYIFWPKQKRNITKNQQKQEKKLNKIWKQRKWFQTRSVFTGHFTSCWKLKSKI